MESPFYGSQDIEVSQEIKLRTDGVNHVFFQSTIREIKGVELQAELRNLSSLLATEDIKLFRPLYKFPKFK